MYCGAPATPPPPELVEAVLQAVRADDRIAAAHLFQFYEEAGGARLVVGMVVTTGADKKAAAAELVRRLGGAVPAGQCQDVMVLHGPMLETIAASTEPIT